MESFTFQLPLHSWNGPTFCFRTPSPEPKKERKGKKRKHVLKSPLHPPQLLWLALNDPALLFLFFSCPHVVPENFNLDLMLLFSSHQVSISQGSLGGSCSLDFFCPGLAESPRSTPFFGGFFFFWSCFHGTCSPGPGIMASCYLSPKATTAHILANQTMAVCVFT